MSNIAVFAGLIEMFAKLVKELQILIRELEYEMISPVPAKMDISIKLVKLIAKV